MKTAPSRTCLGCRRTRPQAALVRLVRTSSGTVVVDTGTRIGRGAYVCPDAACLERGLSRGRLGHAFRKPSEAGPDLAAAVWAAAGREAPAEAALACDMDTDVIAVKA